MIPESITKADNETTKMKQAIEAITFMSRNVQKKEKEMEEIAREKDHIQYTLDAIKRERDYLKRSIDIMAKNEIDQKKKKEPVAATN